MKFWCVIYTRYDQDSIMYSFDVSNTLTFSTALNGGYMSASVMMYESVGSLSHAFSILLGRHCVIYDNALNPIYEGFVSRETLNNSELQLELVGYYARGAKIIDDRIYVTSPQTISDIVMDACDLVDSWQKSISFQGGADYNLMLTDSDTGAYIPIDFTDKRVTEAIESCLLYGYDSSNPQQTYIAVYEDRRPQLFFQKTDTELMYDSILIHSGNVVEGEKLTASLEGVFNKVYAVYSNQSDGTSKTTASEDTLSQSEFGVMEGVVQNGGNPEGIAMANALRDYALEKYAWPIQSSNVVVTGILYHVGQGNIPVHRLRAGDTVRFTDLDYMTIFDNQQWGRIKSKIYATVMGTSYVAETNQNTLTLNITDNSFDVLMSRLGLSGGLK